MRPFLKFNICLIAALFLVNCSGAEETLPTPSPSPTAYPDLDGDGYGIDVDCQDDNPEVHPFYPEICDGLDQNCNGEIDEYLDRDFDGYSSCETQSDPVDCNDAVDSIYPAAPELCDGLDNDCDDVIDESVEVSEVCNFIDDDCDGFIDEGVATIFYYDSDGDGYGNPNSSSQDCIARDDFVEVAGDCDDNDPEINAGAPEICDGLNNDCDDVIDEGFGDSDGDGVANCIDPCPTDASDGCNARVLTP